MIMPVFFTTEAQGLFQVVTISIQWRPASSVRNMDGLAEDEFCQF